MNYKNPHKTITTLVGVIIAGIMLLILVSTALLSQATISGRYEDLFVSSKDYKAIKATREKGILLQNPQVSFDGETPFIDSEGTWYYSMLEGSETARNPKIKLVTNDPKIRLVVKKEELSDENIANNTEFKFMVYNDKTYQVFTMHATSLPILSVTYDDSIKLEREVDTKMTLNLYDNRKDVKSRNISTTGVFHPRGAISYTYPKQNYKLSFRINEESDINNDLSLLGLREDDDYILNGAYLDPEKIRTVFESNLWTEASGKQNLFGITNGVNYRYVEVFENKKYWGLYALGFPVDEKQLELKQTNDGLYTDSLFKKVAWDTNRNPDKEFLSDWELNSPTPNYINAWNELIDYDKLIKEGNDASEIRKKTDMLTAIDLSLFINFTQNYDISNGRNGIYNIYLSFIEHEGRRVALYTPWDFDLSFGHYELTETLAETTYRYTSDQNFDITSTPVYSIQQLGDPAINSQLVNRYSELRENYWSEEHIDKLIDDYQKQIYDSGAFRRDLVRWPNARHNEENEKLSFFRQYVHERLKYMDKYINDLENGKITYQKITEENTEEY